MRLTAARRALLFAAVATLLWLAFPPGAAAEQLPVKVYTVENGLAHNRIKHIVQDSRGFLWFCTADGLSRFDGSQFVNYQLDDGLLAPSINDLVEAGDGTYWIATNSDGVFRFDPRVAATGAHAGVSRFTRAAVGAEPVSNRVNVLLRDPDGTIWAGTDGGLFALDERHAADGFKPVPLHLPGRPDIQVAIWTFVRDRSGALWIGTRYGLVRRSAGGAMRAIPVRPGPDDDNVSRSSAARTAGCGSAIAKDCSRSTRPRRSPALRRYTTSDGLESDNIIALHSSPDGRIWIKTFGTGITEFDGTSFRTYGLGARGVDGTAALTEDREGNLWLGTNAFGVIKITKRGWTTYAEPEGLGSSVTSIFETPGGDLFVSSRAWRVSRFQDGRFATVRPALPADRHRRELARHQQLPPGSRRRLVDRDAVRPASLRGAAPLRGSRGRASRGALHHARRTGAGRRRPRVRGFARRHLDRVVAACPRRRRPLGPRHAHVSSLFRSRRPAPVHQRGDVRRGRRRPGVDRVPRGRTRALPRRPLHDWSCPARQGRSTASTRSVRTRVGRGAQRSHPRRRSGRGGAAGHRLRPGRGTRRHRAGRNRGCRRTRLRRHVARHRSPRSAERGGHALIPPRTA